jgi:hypothetical protein
VRHLRFAEPITVLMSGHAGAGAILKPKLENGRAGEHA